MPSREDSRGSTWPNVVRSLMFGTQVCSSSFTPVIEGLFIIVNAGKWRSYLTSLLSSSLVMAAWWPVSLSTVPGSQDHHPH